MDFNDPDLSLMWEAARPRTTSTQGRIFITGTGGELTSTDTVRAFWNIDNSNHNTGTAVDFNATGLTNNPYTILCGLEGYKNLNKVLDEEANKEQEDTDIGFLGRLTIVNKEK